MIAKREECSCPRCASPGPHGSVKWDRTVTDDRHLAVRRVVVTTEDLRACEACGEQWEEWSVRVGTGPDALKVWGA